MILMRRLNTLKALIFGTCKKNIIIYSQMMPQLYQSYSLTAVGFNSGKKSINWVSGHFKYLIWP